MSNSTTPIEREMTFGDLLALLLRGWKLLLITTIIGGLVSFYLARLMPPVYQSDALIQIDTDDKGMFGSLGELTDAFGAVSKAETETEILQSRMVLAPVVQKLNLQYSASPISKWRRFLGKEGRVKVGYLKLPSSESAEATSWLLIGRDAETMTLVSPSKDSIAQVKEGESCTQAYGDDTVQVLIESFDAAPGEVFELDEWDPADVTNTLYLSLSVGEKGKKTGILELTYTHRYPDQAANILNAIMRSYTQQNIDAKSAEAQKTLGFLKEQIPAVKARLDSADAALNAYRKSKGTIDLSAESKIALDQELQLDQQLLELQQKKQDLTRLYEESHPQVNALNSQIDRLRNRIGSSHGKVKKLPQTQQEVLKLTRDVTVATAFYQTMLDKIQQLEVVRAGEVGSARIIDTAQINTIPVKPNRKAVLVIGLVSGFLLGFSVVLIKKVVDRGIYDALDIEKIAQVSVFCQIPKSDKERKISPKNNPKDILAIVSPNDLAVESLRGLRTAIEFSLLAQGGKILGITGLTPGVGKSFVSTNLAALFASSGRKTLLIDADLRKGRLHQYTSSGERSPGLVELMRGKSSLENSLRNSALNANLWFLSTGTLPPNPSEMLGSQQLGKLIEQIKSEFDLIIIDTSPILLVTDAALVLQHADHATLVLEQGEHTVSEIQEAVRLAKVKDSLGLSLAVNHCSTDLLNRRYSRYGKYTASAV